jgi:hypothetical protein
MTARVHRGSCYHRSRLDWLWPIYEQHVRKLSSPGDDLGRSFFAALGQSSATLYVMEPIGETIRFKGLGKWPLAEVPDLLADPNAFIADRFGGGKFKVNFHHKATFVGTHNFRTRGEERWRAMEEVSVEDPVFE